MVRRLPLLFLFLFTACATLNQIETPKYVASVDKIEAPLQTLQRLAVAALPLGLRSSSSNGREFQSNYFYHDLSQGTYKPADEAQTRSYVQVTVLGDRRPYKMEVFVTREERVLQGDDFTYIVKGHDIRLAKELASKLRDQLSKRREDRNIIDDFRAF